MAGPVYPYRDRRFDHEEWPSLERSELRAANHRVFYGGAMVISAYPFVITRDAVADFYPDFDKDARIIRRTRRFHEAIR